MKKTICYQCGILLLLLVLVVSVTGCNQQTAAGESNGTAETAAYTGALRADYEDALDVTSQLALGVLRLEDTANAVTAEQATQALPIWKTLQNIGTSAQSERLAVTKQLEGLLSEPQVSAIVSMQLTEADAQAWLQEQGPIAAAPGGQMPSDGAGAQERANAPAMSDEDRAAMRERFQNMTEEERANMQAQFGQGNRASGGTAPSGGNVPTGGFAGATSAVSTMLTRSVVSLLIERSGQSAVAAVPSTETETTSSATESTEPASAESPPADTATLEPETDTSVVPIITLVPWSTPEATPTPEATLTNASATTPASVQTAAVDSSSASPALEGTEGGKALVQKLDTDPGPPLTIQITTNSSEQNPLLEGGLIYRVGGFVYNPTDETYQVTAVHVTFFDDSGFRGAFYAFPRKAGERPGGEWISHGAVEAQVSCEVLGPGESCPFVAEIAGQDMASFLVHPDAKVAEWHESVGVTLSDTKIADTGTSYVRISGTATNPNGYAVKNVVISALLLDGSGQTVSMGTGVVTSLAAGASTNFEVYVAKKAYASYQLHARAEQATN